MLDAEEIDWLREDWTRFAEHALGIQQWEGQRRVMRALQRHRRVAVPSGHKVGKTHCIASIALTIASLYPNARVITTAPTNHQLRENVWGEIRSQYRASWLPLGGQLYEGRNEWKIGDLWYCVGVSTDEPDSFQGKHSEEGVVCVIMDECQAIKRSIWTAAKTMTSDANGYLLVVANPTMPSGPFYDAVKTDPSFQVVQLSCYDHPNIVQGRKVMPGVTQGLIDEFEGTPEEKPRLRGEFNEEGTGALISLGDLNRCALIDSATLEKDGVHIGVDIADQGSDFCVACVTINREIVEIVKWRAPGADSLMQTAGQIQVIAAKHDCEPQNVHIDGIGVGAGVVARLHELGFAVDNVCFGAGPSGEWYGLHGDYVEFQNRRAELYWTMRALVSSGGFKIPEKFREVVADLAAPSWNYVSDRKVKIEPKDKIKERLGRSPDCGDAAVYSLSRYGNRTPQMRRLR